MNHQSPQQNVHPRGKPARRRKIFLLAAVVLLLSIAAAAFLVIKAPWRSDSVVPVSANTKSPSNDSVASVDTGATASLPPIPVTHNLSDKVICIDPAHTSIVDDDEEPVGPNSSNMTAKQPAGNRGVSSGTDDYQVTQAVANDLAKLLKAEGAKVIMTRTGDVFYGGGRERAHVANSEEADLLLNIDVSTSDDHSLSGVSTALPALVLGWTEDIYRKSNTAALMIQANMVHDLPAVNQGTTEKSDNPEFNWSDVPVVSARVGYLSNSDEDTRLASPEYQQQVAQALLKGIELYFSD